MPNRHLNLAPSVHSMGGVGTAACCAEEDFATAAQGTKADSAIQTINGLEPDAAGNISLALGTQAPASAVPLPDGIAEVGVSNNYAREDHVHPLDASILKIDADTLTITDISHRDAIQEVFNIRDKLRAQVARARIVNPIDSTPWFKPQTWTTNTNFPMGTVVVSTDNVNCYIQKWASNGVGGVSATSGSGPVGKQSAKVADGTCVWEWVSTVRGQMEYSATTVQVMGTTAALATLTNPITKTFNVAGIASGINVARFDGGIPIDLYGAVAMMGPNGGTVAAPDLNGYSQSHSMTFVTDADRVVLNGVSPIFNVTKEQLLIEVNDIALSDSVYGYRSTANLAPTASFLNPAAYVLDLSFLPQGSIKKVRLFGMQGWSRISYSSQYKVWKPSDTNLLTITGEGDSTMGGGNSAATQFGTWFNRMARKLGFQGLCNMAVGGTRFSDPGVRTTFGQRLDRLLQTNADIYCVSVHNDVSFSTQVRTAAFLDYFNQFLTKAPGKFLVVFGCIPLQGETESNTQPGGNYYICETDIKNAVAQIGSPYILFYPVVLDPAGQWVSGTGSAESPNGTGNSDWMWGLDPNGSVDGHPLWRHSLYMGHRFAYALCDVFNI